MLGRAFDDQNGPCEEDGRTAGGLIVKPESNLSGPKGPREGTTRRGNETVAETVQLNKS